MYRIIGADGREYGPIPAEQLRQWIAEGRANAGTKALAEGSTEWKPLAGFPEFSWLFTAAAAQKSSIPPATPPAGTTLPRNNFFAVTGLILAILSFCCCCCYGLPFNLAGLLFSIIGLVQIRNNPQLYHGQGVAIAGLVLSLLSILVSVVLVIIGGLAGNWHELSRGIHRL